MASLPIANQQQSSIIIIGAGLAGLTLALALSQVGVIVTIYELREASVTAEGGFLALAPNALRVLERIGAYQAISQQGYNYEELYWYSARNLGLIGTVWNGSKARYGYKAVRVARGLVRRTLLEMARERDIEIHYGFKCTEVTEDTAKENVTVSFANGESRNANAVIGADGIHSKLRTFLQPDSTPTFSGQMGIGGPVSRDRLWNDEAGLLPLPAMILGKNNSFALMPCTYTGDKIGVFATIEAEDRPRDEWMKLGADKAVLAKMFRNAHGDESEWPYVVKTAAREVETDNMSLWPFYQVPILQKWISASGRVVVIGDAAHGIPPTGGQGAAMAFEDAVTLADVITLKASDKQKVLMDWEQHRKERIEKVLAFTSRGGDVRKSSSGLFQQIVKEWVMWALFWFKGKEMGLAWLYEYDTKAQS